MRGVVVKYGHDGYPGPMTDTKKDLRDRRIRGIEPRTAPDGMQLVGREEAAKLAGVSQRTITRWVSEGYLTKYVDNRGRARFDPRQAKAMNTFEPEPESGGSVERS